jgi:hypothetical protein
MPSNQVIVNSILMWVTTAASCPKVNVDNNENRGHGYWTIIGVSPALELRTDGLSINVALIRET